MSNYKEKLRNRGQYHPGFYSTERESLDLDKSFELLNLNKTSRVSNIKSNYMQYILSLNSVISNSLKHQKGSTIKFSRFETNKQFKQHLMKKYDLNNRYKDCLKLCIDFGINTESHISEHSFYKLSSFQIRVCNGRIIKFKNKELKSKRFVSNPSISIRFQVTSETSYTREEIDQLVNFENQQ